MYIWAIRCMVPSFVLPPASLAIGVTTEEQNKEITVEVTAEQDSEPATSEPSEPQPEVNEERQLEATEQSGAPARRATS